MDALEKLEASLDESLRERVPAKIPRDWAKVIAGNLWWIVLISGVLQLYSAIDLWDFGHRPVDMITAVNYYTTGVVRHLSIFFYLAVFITVGVALLLLLSASSLKAMRKAGWNLAFYSILLDVLASATALFAEGGGVRAFLSGIVGAVLAAYVLFQVREHFAPQPIRGHEANERVGHKKEVASADAPATKPSKDED